MTNEEAIKRLNKIKAIYKGMDNKSDVKALNMAIEALKSLDKLDEIIVEQIDISNNQVECQTLRWVLDKMSEMSGVEE